MARITFEVRPRYYWCIRSSLEIILDVQLLREQNRYDQIPLILFARLQRVLPLADSVVDEIVCKETELLDEIIPRMFKVMQKVAEYSCDYVRRGHLGGQSLFWMLHVLMIAVRAVGGLVHPGAIEEIESDLTKVIEDFERAVGDVETLRLIKETGEHLFLAGVHSQLLRYRARAFT